MEELRWVGCGDFITITQSGEGKKRGWRIIAVWLTDRPSGRPIESVWQTADRQTDHSRQTDRPSRPAGLGWSQSVWACLIGEMSQRHHQSGNEKGCCSSQLNVPMLTRKHLQHVLFITL